jgi:hypothetical protein
MAYLVSEFTASIRTQAFKKFSANSHFGTVMNITTLSPGLLALAKPCEELTILLFLCQA